MKITDPLFRETASGKYGPLFTFRTLADGSCIAASGARFEPRRMRRAETNARFTAARALRAGSPVLAPIPLREFLTLALTAAAQPAPAIVTPYPVCIPTATALALAYMR
jgi:hypothetical protein